MKYSVITIGREFCTGGLDIAREVARRLGGPMYDKELITLAAKESGLSEQAIAAGEKRPSGSLLYNLYTMGSDLPLSDQVFVVQSQIIRGLADKGPCVIVGRSADYILKDRKDALHVFVHADMDFRAERIVRLYGQSEKTPEQRLRDKDKKRAVNYEHYTGREWGKSQNYTLTLNSGAIGVERCVDLLADLVGPIKADPPAPETAQ